MNKDSLRKKYKSLRLSLDQSSIDNYSIQIANQLIKLPIWDKIYFHLFLSISEQKEVDTSYVLTLLQGRDKEIVVSKSTPHGKLINYLLTDNTILKKNKWNIPEPVDGIEIPNKKIDVVFVPLLAFDTKGHRIGYGKGYYDRFLSQCKAEVIKIGLSFFGPIDETIPTDSNDVALDMVITPTKVYQF